MRLAYDFHIHSCLSPCADDDMTPYNLVNMASIAGLDIIALTDHNSTRNCRAAIAAGQQAGLVVIPGMELCTAEEIHVVCLFGELDAAESFGDMVYTKLLSVKNKPEVFGNQLIMDEYDSVLETESVLLSNASGISINNVPAICSEYGGICYPANIDRPSYSILAVFGMIERSMGFSCAELTFRADLEALIARNPDLAKMCRLCSSDAHALEVLAAHNHDYIELDACAPKAVIEALGG